MIFAALVAFGAAYVQFKLFRTNGFVWALACASPLVPLIDWLCRASATTGPLHFTPGGLR